MGAAYDLCVYDSTPAGLLAAIAAAKGGLRIIVVTEDRHIGGMQTSGLGWTNAGQRATIGGHAREFFDRIHQYYVHTYGPEAEQVEVCSQGMHFEPHVAEHIYEQWIAETNITVLRESPIAAVHKVGPRLEALQTVTGQQIRARCFIDASYEGDLLALAGCAHHIGREAQSRYREPLAGIRAPESEFGQEDHALQPMDYRLCLTRDPSNRVPFRKPEHYNPADYAWEGATLKQNPPERLHQALPLNPMPNGKTDSRTGEWVGQSWTYPEASYEERRRIDAAHRDHSAGYIWFLLHENVLPSALRDELTEWGHAADEFTDNDHWPYHIYVREARRLVGDFVMTQADVTDDRFKDDAVALGSFFLDVRQGALHCGPERPASLQPEGSFGRHGTRPYEIPYRALLPKRADAENLLVPLCLSASHVAFSTIRVEPTWMMLGHAAGTAAALALEQGCSIHDLATDQLQNTLSDEGQILAARAFHNYWPAPPAK